MSPIDPASAASQSPDRQSLRRRGGRRAIRSCSPGRIGQAVRKIPAYRLLDDDALAAIEAQADWILAEIGIEFRGDDAALALFRAAGAAVDGPRVRFEPGHVRALCQTAPAIFELQGRRPESTVQLGGDHIVLMPGYGSPFVTDLDRGRRYASLSDYRNFVRLAEASDALHHSGGTVCEPVDIPVNKRHLDMVHAHLTLSAKPFMGSVTSVARAIDSIALTRIAHGAAALDAAAFVQANINVNSPLVFDETMSSVLRTYAAAGQCVAVSPAVFGGAMGPVFPAAMVAQTLAEGMVGLTLAQLTRPGCPCVLGSFHAVLNMRSGSLSFGAPEAHLVTLAMGQLGRRLGVPVRSGGGHITSSNAADAQAMQESAGAMWATLLSGAHQIWHAAGWLEGGLTMSYEKFAMDLDHCGAMLKLLGGMSLEPEAFARDAYLETGPGAAFLASAHTLRHHRRANFDPSIAEPGPYERWIETGAPTLDQRATARWKALLEQHETPPMDPGIAEALADYIARRKSEMPDAWY